MAKEIQNLGTFEIDVANPASKEMLTKFLLALSKGDTSYRPFKKKCNNNLGGMK